jgi:hypothetical protein
MALVVAGRSLRRAGPAILISLALLSFGAGRASALLGSATRCVAGLRDPRYVTSGSNGTCSPAHLCTAGAGYDGPTGLGTPDGTGAF